MEELQKRADDFELRKKRMNERVTELFAELDPDGDGTLTKEQTWTFVQKMTEATKKTVTREEFEAEYEKLDFNADQKVTLEEIRKQGIDRPDQRENLAIGIAWIGHTLDPSYLPHRHILDKLVRFEGSKKAPP